VKFAPRFVYKEKLNQIQVEVIYGANAALTCASDGYPQPTISWFFKSKDRKVEEQLKIEEAILRLEKVDEDREGEYKCLVENSMGRVKRSFEVKNRPKGE
jgi:hypothetical protein